MEMVQGNFGAAKAYVENLDNSTRGQILALCDQPFTAGLDIRIMPDAHAGAGCVIGTTMSIKDKIVPNLVGVDIGCGMETVKLAPCELDFAKLDKVIKHRVPFGKRVRKEAHPLAEQCRIADLTCKEEIFSDPNGQAKEIRAIRSIGSLGGGNHFIELDKDAATGDLYLVVHSGSRNPGLETAVHHQKIAQTKRKGEAPKELAWLEGDDFDAYMHDMRIMQEYADLNRKAIVQVILENMDWQAVESFSTIHNYVNFEDMILRKGAVSARKGEKLLIPFNMRDGSVICEGLGNQDWNCSAPHGAGRLCSRQAAFKSLDLNEFKKSMEGIYSTCVSRCTLDESPAAYKPMEQILNVLGETAVVRNVLKPIYNFKASS